MISLIQCDDFAPDAVSVRDAVISGEFKTVKGPDGGDYTGVQFREMDNWTERISYVVGRTIKPKLSGFRLNLKGELPHSWVHSDDICAEMASVLYLNPPNQCSGGTAFWKHVGFGIDSAPTSGEIIAAGFNPNWMYRTLSNDWKELDYWEMTNFCAMKWNRFITYPTKMFHSRYPFEAFGEGPKDGRLVWVCFFDFAK